MDKCQSLRGNPLQGEVLQVKCRGLDQKTYHDLQNRDKGYLREHKGVISGLDWAIDIIEQAGPPQIFQTP